MQHQQDRLPSPHARFRARRGKGFPPARAVSILSVISEWRYQSGHPSSPNPNRFFTGQVADCSPKAPSYAASTPARCLSKRHSHLSRTHSSSRRALLLHRRYLVGIRPSGQRPSLLRVPDLRRHSPPLHGICLNALRKGVLFNSASAGAAKALQCVYEFTVPFTK